MLRLALLVVLGCGASETPSPEPAESSEPEPSAAAPTESEWVVTVTPPSPELSELVTETSAHFTSTVASSKHILIVRVAEFGVIEEREPNGDTSWYDYAWLEVVRPLYGNTDDVHAPFAERFPVFHMTGMQMADGSHGHAVPSPLSRLRGRTGQEAIFIGNLPTSRASVSGEVPQPLDRDGYGAYLVELREIAGRGQGNDVMAVVGPM